MDRREQGAAPEPGAEYVSEIMKRESAAAARGEPPRRRRSDRPVLAALLVVLAGLVGWNVVRAVRDPEVFTERERVASAQFTLFLTQQAIQAYRDSARTLPPDLAAVGEGERGLIEYARTSDTSYTLRAALGDSAFTYRSGQDIRPFARAVDVLRGGGQ